jgi:hypothetical protein
MQQIKFQNGKTLNLRLQSESDPGTSPIQIITYLPCFYIDLSSLNYSYFVIHLTTLFSSVENVINFGWTDEWWIFESLQKKNRNPTFLIALS